MVKTQQWLLAAALATLAPSAGGCESEEGTGPGTTTTSTTSTTAPTCGDGSCASDEDCSSCPADCGACCGACSDCGDGVCDAGEGCSTCPGDCGACPSSSVRIGYSADGNINDEDDWAATAVALAILDQYGLTDQLVHLDYNSILCENDPAWAAEEEATVLGAASRYGIANDILFDDQTDPEGARNSIRDAVDASSSDHPLYFIIAGPTQIVFEGIERADPAHYPYVWAISHNSWNDGTSPSSVCNGITKRDIIELGVNWVQIRDQNGNCSDTDPAAQGLCTTPFGQLGTPPQWAPWDWLASSADADLNWVHSRLLATTRADASDAGMTFFLMSGIEDVSIDELEDLLEADNIPAQLSPRSLIRMEAENFRSLEGYVLESTGAGVSQRTKVRLTGDISGRIATAFNEIYATDGNYELRIRYFDDSSSGDASFTLRVDGIPQGASWTGSQNDDSWRTAVFNDVVVRLGDPIEIEGAGTASDAAEIDYLELSLQSAL